MNYQRREGGKPSRKLFSQVRMKSFEVEEEGIPFRILWHEGLASGRKEGAMALGSFLSCAPDLLCQRITGVAMKMDI